MIIHRWCGHTVRNVIRVVRSTRCEIIINRGLTRATTKRIVAKHWRYHSDAIRRVRRRTLYQTKPSFTTVATVVIFPIVDEPKIQTALVPSNDATELDPQPKAGRVKRSPVSCKFEVLYKFTLAGDTEVNEAQENMRASIHS